MKGLDYNGRRNRISGFFCTDHFLLRLWERRINSGNIVLFINALPAKRPLRFCLIVAFGSKGKSRENALIVKFRGRLLITAFFTHLESYMGKKKKDHFILSPLKYFPNA